MRMHPAGDGEHDGIADEGPRGTPLARRTALVVAAAAVLLIVAVTAAVVLGGDPPPLPAPEARSFAAALASGRGPTEEATAVVTRFREQAGVVASRVRVVDVRRRGDGAEATLGVRQVLRGLGEWRYRTTVAFQRRDDAWVPRWAPSAVHPQLRAGDTVTRTRTRPPRGAILAADGTPLVSGDGRVPADGTGLAPATVGRLGPATAEDVARLGTLYEPGDVVGQSGLERTFEPRLAGSPSGTVAFDGAGGRHVVVHEFRGAPPEGATTTLRLDLQRTADAALARVREPAALVAVDAATGGILAVANRPVGSGFNRALAGRYPPGSTFKVVTTEALLTDGRGPDSTVECATTATVGGRRFRNFEGESFGRQSLRDAFAHSCNTAFVTEAATLTDDELVAAARRFGFDTPYETGVAASHASFPMPRDTTERAAAAIGQARVLATPVHMASVAAAVADGTWRAPHLPAGVPPAAVATARPTPAAIEPLRQMMRAVVTSGTGTAAAGVPGLAGKTGTAEYGSGDPLPTHAWFIGFRNGVGFAVVVEGGGVGGRVAAPIAARFATAL